MPPPLGGSCSSSEDSAKIAMFRGLFPRKIHDFKDNMPCAPGFTPPKTSKCPLICGALATKWKACGPAFTSVMWEWGCIPGLWPRLSAHKSNSGLFWPASGFLSRASAWAFCPRAVCPKSSFSDGLVDSYGVFVDLNLQPSWNCGKSHRWKPTLWGLPHSLRCNVLFGYLYRGMNKISIMHPSVRYPLC